MNATVKRWLIEALVQSVSSIDPKSWHGQDKERRRVYVDSEDADWVVQAAKRLGVPLSSFTRELIDIFLSSPSPRGLVQGSDLIPIPFRWDRGRDRQLVPIGVVLRPDQLQALDALSPERGDVSMLVRSAIRTAHESMPLDQLPHTANREFNEDLRLTFANTPPDILLHRLITQVADELDLPFAHVVREIVESRTRPLEPDIFSRVIHRPTTIAFTIKGNDEIVQWMRNHFTKYGEASAFVRTAIQEYSELTPGDDNTTTPIDYFTTNNSQMQKVRLDAGSYAAVQRLVEIEGRKASRIVLAATGCALERRGLITVTKGAEGQGASHGDSAQFSHQMLRAGLGAPDPAGQAL